MMHRHFERSRLFLFLAHSAFFITACSVRSVQIKRAEQRYQKGQVLASRGEIDKAIVNFNKSMAMARGAGYKAGVAHNLNELGLDMRIHQALLQ